MPDTTATVSGETGETCPESGPYRSSGRAGAVILIQKGELFPADVDGSPTVWTLVSEDE